jgi:hypothetical protein
VVGQVLVADDNNPDEDGNEEEQRSVGSDDEDGTFTCTSLFGSKRKVTFAVVLFLAIVVIVVGSVVATTTSKSQESQKDDIPTVGNTMPPSPMQPPTQTPTMQPNIVPTAPPTQPPTMQPTIAPTVPPTAAPTSTLQGLIELLSSVSFDNGAALQTLSSSQDLAVKWLANNTNLVAYEDKQKIQRYALAVFYYSTNGNGWQNLVGWLSDDDECRWYNLANSSSCDENKSVMELDLTGNNLVGKIPNELAMLSESTRKFSLVLLFPFHPCTNRECFAVHPATLQAT